MPSELLIRPVFRYTALTNPLNGNGFSIAVQGASSFTNVVFDVSRFYLPMGGTTPVSQPIPVDPGTITFQPITTNMFFVHLHRVPVPAVPPGGSDLGVGTITITIDPTTDPKMGTLPIAFGEPSPTFKLPGKGGPAAAHQSAPKKKAAKKSAKKKKTSPAA